MNVFGGQCITGQQADHKRLPFTIATLGAAVQDLRDELVEIKGQDSYYDDLVAAVGELYKSDSLVLPTTFVIRTTSSNMVGRPDGHAHMSQAEWAQIYHLNKDACPDPAQAIKFALLRVEAVKCGWLKEGDSNGIVRSPPPTQAQYVATLNADLNAMKDQIQLAETAAFILPMVGEYVFRTLGHHYREV